MSILAFADRCRRELIRDPLSIIFGVALPLVLLSMMSMLGQNLPVNPFPVGVFAPGMAVFAQTFLMLFGGLLLATDRTTAFLSRTFASPMSAGGYLAAYALPLIPLGLAQGVICLAAALALGLEPTWRLLPALAALLPSIALFTALGLLLGTLCTDRQLGGVASIFIQVASLLGGIWFDLDLIGGAFGKFARALPFCHAVSAVTEALAGNAADAALHSAVVLAYAAVIGALAAVIFARRARNGG